jgi:diguanylate cyclase (GGDEF)-like protein
MKLMGRRGRVVALPGLQEEFHLAQRYQGFQQEIARLGEQLSPPVGKIEVVECSAAERLEALGPADGYYVGSEQLMEIARVLETLPGSASCVGFSNTEQARVLLERGIISAIIDESRYQQGYFALQKAYEAVLKRKEHARVSGVTIPSTVVFSANASAVQESLHNAFEMLVRQRTEILCSYKERLEQANAKLVNLSITDPLTGLYNRRKFEEAIENETARAQRYGPVSLLMIDLNRFKLINDRYGHQAGDDALKAVARVLKACCRSTDTCARFGGDEFAVILPHSNRTAAVVVRDRILQQIAKTVVPLEHQQLTISLSIGIATLLDDALDTAGLVSAADSAMYEAKAAYHAGHIDESAA